MLNVLTPLRDIHCAILGNRPDVASATINCVLELRTTRLEWFDTGPIRCSKLICKRSRRIVWSYSAVVYEHRRGAGDHIVRVVVVDGEVAHLAIADVVVDGFDGDLVDVVGVEFVAGAEVGCVDPGVLGVVPGRVVLGGVQDGRFAVSGVHGEVGEVGVVGGVQLGDGARLGGAGGGVGGLDAVADLDVLDRFVAAVGHGDGGFRVEAVGAAGGLAGPAGELRAEGAEDAAGDGCGGELLGVDGAGGEQLGGGVAGAGGDGAEAEAAEAELAGDPARGAGEGASGSANGGALGFGGVGGAGHGAVDGAAGQAGEGGAATDPRPAGSAAQPGETGPPTAKGTR